MTGVQTCALPIYPVISGSGTNIKMMEYIAYNLPVFTTRFGARGLELNDREDVFYFSHDNLQEILEYSFSARNMIQWPQMATKAKEKNKSTIDMETAVRSSQVKW